MQEHPILFTAPMVRAILDGAKTQTRRALKVQPIDVLPMKEDKVGIEWVGLMQREPRPKGTVFRCKLGQAGDRLWVRETWRTDESLNGKAPSAFSAWPVRYEADGEVLRHGAFYGNTNGKTRVSIHMPRWASRILLEIAGVRVERLQDISEADAIAEGIEKTAAGLWCLYGQAEVDGTFSPIASYRALWNSINGAGAWDANPWVWAVEFKRVMP